MNDPHLGALHVRSATVGQLQTAASTILAPLAVTAKGVDGFRADIDAVAVGRLSVARIRGSGHLVARTPRVITSTDPELLKITLHRSPRPAAVDQAKTPGQPDRRVVGLLDLDYDDIVVTHEVLIVERVEG